MNFLLALAFWLHMVATTVWVGGLALMALVVWPGARAALGPGPQLAELLRAWQRRFNPLAWVSLAVLIVTGLVQMSANKNYDGFLNIANPWTAAILAKHLAVGGMVLIGGYMQWGLQPALARLAVLEARGRPAPELDRLRRRELVLTRLNLLCGLIVLALTAVARVL
ncbi:MAG: CopD family protein [Anaerolineales bacterium]